MSLEAKKTAPTKNITMVTTENLLRMAIYNDEETIDPKQKRYKTPNGNNFPKLTLTFLKTSRYSTDINAAVTNGKIIKTMCPEA